MTLINRESVAAPTLKRETVPVPALGGDVVVRGLKLSERLALREAARSANDRGDAQGFVNALLAMAVIDCNAEAVFTAEQWDTWGAEHPEQYGSLFDKAYELSGCDGTAAKNG